MKYFFSVFSLLWYAVIVHGQTIQATGPTSICGTGTVPLTVTGAAAGATFQWRKDGVAIAGATAINYTATSTGSYNVVITNAIPPFNVAAINISITPKPIADFSFTPATNICSGTPIIFTSNATSGTPPYTYSWVFGDGNTSTQASPSHAFTSLGCGSFSYNVSLTVTDAKGCISNTITKTVTIKQAPDVQLTDLINPGTPFSNCANDPSATNPDYTVSVGNISPSAACINSYNINWGDGVTANNVTFPLTHTYTQLGAYNLQVTAIGNGCSGTKTYVIANQKNPDIGIGTFGLTEGCAPLPVSIVLTTWATNSPGTTYLLQYGDGTSTAFTHPINPTFTDDTIIHNYTTTSCPDQPVYNLTITATNACRTKTFIGGDIVVKIKPQSDFTINKTPACTGQSVCFTNTTKSGFDVNCNTFGTTLWDFGDPVSGSNNTSAQNSPCHIYATPGVYTVTLTTTNVCGPSVITHTVCVTPPPAPGFTIDVASGCSPLAVAATNTTNFFNACAAPTYKWRVDYIPGFCDSTSLWNFSNGTNDSSASPAFLFVNPGTYKIVLLINSPCGADSLNKTVTVAQKPQVTISPIAAICANGSINPVADVTGCSPTVPLQYSWVFTDGTPATSVSLVPGNILYNTLGIHPIQLSVTNECGVTAVPASVNVTSPPVANAGADKIICSQAGTLIGTAGVPGITYTWAPATGLDNAGTAATNVTLTYNGINADTVYTYVVTASAGVDCSSTDTVKVTVNKRPVVILNPASATVCAGSTIQLTAAGAATYNWSPATGLSSSTADTVTATVAAAVVYQVIGTGANACADTATVTISVQDYPVTNAGADSTVCNNTTAVQFTGLPTGGVWSGPNVTANGSFNPVAADNGAYTLYYTVSLGLCSKTDSLLVSVINPPVINAGNDTTVCQNNNTILLTGTPAGGSWSGSLLVTPGGTFSPSATGVYNLFYTYGSGSCIATDTMVVTVGPGIINNTINPNQSVCVNTPPGPITGQAATGGNGTPAYQWQVSTDSVTWVNINGETGLNYTPPILATTSFYRRLAFTTLCSGTQGSISNVIKITIRQDAKASFASNPTTGCAPFNLSTAINVTPFPDRDGLYQWLANGVQIGSNSTGAFPGYIIPASNAAVTIKLVTTSQYGCRPDSLEQQFVTVITAQAQFTKDTGYGCSPLPVTFTNTSSIINNISFNWNFGNGITSKLAQPGTIIFNASPDNSDTTYLVTLKAYNGCDTTVWQDSVKIRANPKARFGVDTTFGCSPFTVHIDNTSLGAPNTYYWNFGDGHLDTTYTTGPLNYTYNSGPLVDTFKIQLIAANECKRDTQVVNVRVAPNDIRANINISSTDLFGCAPHIIAINNGSTGATTFTWNFGDGSPTIVTNANQTTIPHEYTDTGTFTIQVNISNGCSDTVVYRGVTVYTKPTAGFTTNKSIYCEGDTIHVNNTSINATNYQWFWGDGTGSTGFEPVHVYNAPGSYTIYLRAEKTNNTGLVCFDTLVRQVTILGQPSVTVQSNINGLNCAPFTLVVTAPGIINETANWYFYDSTVVPSIVTATGTPAQYTFNKPGSFYVKLLAQNAAGCSDSTIIPFVVQGMPVASFTPSNLSVCTSDTTISYLNTTTYNGNDAIRYNWLVNGVPLSANGNFTHEYTVPALAVLPRVFNTWLIVSNTFGCSDTAKATLQMNPSSKASFSITNTNDCVPFIPSVINNAQYASVYKWLVNGVVVSTDAAPQLIINQAATLYTVTLITDNIYGCKPDTFSVSFTSRIKPLAAFTISDTLGCTGVLNVATINTTTNASTYTWDWGDNTPGSSFTNPTHLYTSIGQYEINLVASDGVCRDTASQVVKVNIKPAADFTVNTTLTCDTAHVQFINQTINGTSYVWDFGDGTSSTDINPPKTFAPSAVPYTIKLVATSAGGCKDSAVKANLVLAKVPPAGDFYISPTPVITVPNYTFSFNNLTLNSTNYQYLWSLGDGTNSVTRDVLNHKYADTGSYPIRLIVLDNISNCADTTIKIARIDGFPGWMYIPNAICPKCLQENLRTFLPKGVGLKDYHLQIFTTWGELVFESTSLDSKGSPNQPWDATYLKGGAVMQDAYVWKIQATFKNGSEWLGMIYPGETSYKKAGSITVVR